MDNLWRVITSALFLIATAILIPTWRRQQTFRKLYEANPLPLFCLDPTQKLIQCNQAFARLLGYSSSAECIALFNEYPHYEQAEFDVLEALLQNPLEFDGATEPSLRLVSRYGDRLYRQVKFFQRQTWGRFNLYLTDDGQPQFVTRQHAEFAHFIQQPLFPAFILDDSLTISSASPMAIRYFSLGDASAARPKLSTLFPVNDRTRVVALIERRLAANNRASLTFAALLKTAEVRECQWHFIRAEEPVKNILVLCSMGSGEPPLTSWLDLLVDTTWGHWTIDLPQQTLVLSDRWRSYIGYDSPATEQPLGFWREIIAPLDQDRVIAALTDYISGEVDTFSLEHRLAGPNGVEHAVTSTATAMVRAESGEVIRVYGLHIVAPKVGRRGSRLLPSSDSRAGAGAAEIVDVSSIAHALLNFNAIILGYAYLLRRIDKLPVPALALIETIDEAALEIRDLLSTETATDSKTHRPLSLLDDLNTELGTAVQITGIKLSSDQFAHVQAPLRQMVMFSQLAGQDAPPSLLKCELSMALSTDNCSVCGASLGADQWLILRLEQPGLVLDRAYRVYGFKPGASTSRVGGDNPLAELSQISHNLGGHLILDGLMDTTQLTVYLPIESGFATKVVQGRNPQLAGLQRITVIDDQPAVTGFLSIILSQAGYEVTIYNDPVMALDRLRRQPDATDLIITDQYMPNLSGHAIIQAMRQVRADLPLILCSGHSEHSMMDSTSATSIHTIRKPFEPAALLEIVAGIFEHRSVLP
ncbi:response regulator [Pseudomonadales bacterium]|nr:response regulator [Pseudomonadales bacterium]